MSKSSQYTTSNPLWFVAVSIERGFYIGYEFLNIHADGSVTSEVSPYHSYSIPLDVCSEIVSVQWHSTMPTSTSKRFVETVSLAVYRTVH
jgi:hypothetical protein